MIDRRCEWTRTKCTTKVCWNSGKLDFIGEWQSSDRYEYIAALCPKCNARYWMVKCNGAYILKDRKEKEIHPEFD
jgi:hypothetical protein